MEHTINTFHSPCHEIRQILSNDTETIYCSKIAWQWHDKQEKAISTLVQMAQGRYPIDLTAAVRVKIVHTIKNILSTTETSSESKGCSIRDKLLKCWNGAKPDEIRELVRRDICLYNFSSSSSSSSGAAQEEKKAMLLDISRNISFIIVNLCGTSNKEGEVGKMILEALRGNSQFWMNDEELDHILCLLCVLAAHHGAIADVGSDLLGCIDVGDSKGRGLSLLEMFYRFLCDSKKSIKGDVDETKITHDIKSDDEYEPSKEAPNKTEKNSFLTKAGEVKNRCCTYVSTNGNFSEQHWYNCYTCGLLWDKGCCSLCAQVCHKGHDVGYSRKSSFFCDCGADVGTECERVPCKSLSPLSDGVLSSVYDTALPTIPTTHHEEKSIVSVGDQCLDDGILVTSDFWREASQISSSKYPSIFESSLDNFVDSIDTSIVEKLFEVFNSHFEAWTKQDSIQSIVSNELSNSNHINKEYDSISRKYGTSLGNRNGEHFDASQLNERVYSLVRVFRPNTLNVKLSNELGLIKKSIVSKNERRIIVADKRGRVIIAESNSLLFCEGNALANVRYLSRSNETQLQRSDLSVLGSSKVKSSIMGMTLSHDDDSRLVAWGTSSVHVYMIAESCDKVDCVIELDIGLDPYECETEYVVKAEWLLGSSGNIVVAFCATSVKIFDIRHSTASASNVENEYSCQSVSSYTMGYEDVVIKSGVIIPPSIGSGTEVKDNVIDSPCYKLVLLFDTGRLNFLDLHLDCNDDLEDKGIFNIDYSDCILFPIAGVRRSVGSSFEANGTMTNSLGEGTNLEYLHHSGLLLYKCATSPMLAFILDKVNNIIGSFEFLPSTLTPEMLGSVMDGYYPISAPYTHWTELGIIRRNGSDFYRVSFVGRSSRMNQSKMLYVEFNDETTKVTEIKPLANSLTLGHNASVEGITAYTVPILVGSENGMMSEKTSVPCERILLLSVSSNGSVMLFGEDLSKGAKYRINSGNNVFHANRRRAFSDSILSPNKKDLSIKSNDFEEPPKQSVVLPKFPLTMFEELINVGEMNCLLFGGDSGKAASITKRKLSITSGEFIISPFKEGCTLSVSLCSSDGPTKLDSLKKFPRIKAAKLNEKKEDKGVDEETLVIVAVRILLGSTTTEYLPKEISVMGRQIKLTPGTKRWYDVPLTDEEILLGVTSGFVTISIGASCEGTKNPPIVDSVEVYAQEKNKLSYLFPIHTVNRLYLDSMNVAITVDPTNQEASRKSLDKSILVITHIYHLLGDKVDLTSQVKSQTLRRLIQVTALDSPKHGNVRNHVIDLVKSVQKDNQTMQMLLDEGTLQGISNTLQDLCLKHDIESSSVIHHLRSRVLSKVKDCLTAATLIVKDRPANYKNAIDRMIASGDIKGSIALQAKHVIDIFSGTNYAVVTTTNLIQLAIFETMATAMSTDSSSVNNFAGLKLVSEILSCNDESTVKACCLKLALTLKEIHNFDKLQAYQCDGCTKFPITGFRYTLEEKNIDLCKSCFERGKTFASSKKFRSGTAVLVNGRKLQMEGDEIMSCGHIREMIAKPVPQNIIEQVNKSNRLPGDPTPMDEDDEDDAQLKMALKMSLEESQMEEAVDSESQRSTSFTIHLNVINKIIEVIIQSFSRTEKPSSFHPIPIIDLLLTLVSQCDLPEDQLIFTQTICDAFCQEMLSLLEEYCNDKTPQPTLKRIRFPLLIYLRTFEGLVTKQTSVLDVSRKINVEEQLLHHVDNSISKDILRDSTSKDKTDPRFVCEIHGVPAVRRRCSSGENKDRRFYVCGMDRKSRCRYFKWADEKVSTGISKEVFDKGNLSRQRTDSVGSITDEDTGPEIDTRIQSLLWSLFNVGKRPLQQRLCILLQTLLKKLDSNELISKKDKRTIPIEKVTKLRSILERGRKKDSQRKFTFDQLLSQPPKLGLLGRYGNLLKKTDLSTKFSSKCASEYSVIEASLDFLSKVAGNALRCTQDPQSSWESWFAFLCEIISSNLTNQLRAQAKKMMKKLCGGRRAIYHQIRDRYVFGFQFMKLLLHCEAPLQAALDVREKARRCGQHWRLPNVSWSTLPTGGLIGTQELISEDNYAVITMGNISTVLDDIINIAKNRGENWRHFCALDRLPQKNSYVDIRERSPISILLWMACSLPSQNQVKVLKLMDIALKVPYAQSIQQAPMQNESNVGIVSTDGGGTDIEGSTHNNSLQYNQLSIENKSPQEVLLGGASGLSTGDIYAFIVSFILYGEDPEVRSLASDVCLKIIPTIPKLWVDRLLNRFVSVLISDVGQLGVEAVEFLQFLNILTMNRDIVDDIDVSLLFQATENLFAQQLSVSCDLKLSSDKDATLVEIETSNLNEEKQIFDLAPCVHCQKHPQSSNIVTPTSNVALGRNISHNTISMNSSEKRRQWTSAGVVPSFGNKRRLDNWTLNVVSSEFSCHVQLKARLNISDFYLNVSESRGRFVKKIGIFFSPRPVRFVNELKSSEYAPLWQRCGTISLPRGGSKGSCKLTCPVVAANLKFEYEEFYEKISHSRPSSNGAIVIHCPRCTRAVNNAHGGVCGHCGEVAFQCRKCRHINYDRLDAFLCVECGYCSSGAFQYEISACSSSKAVAIIDDEGLERAARLMLVASNKYIECKGILMKSTKTTKLSGQKRSIDEVNASISKLNGPLKRALAGDLPKISSKSIITGNSNGSKKKRESPDTPNRGDSLTGSSVANRARSLLNLAIQLRNESGNEERASLGDVPDSLSRLVANISRVRSGSNLNRQDNREEDNEGKRNANNEDGPDSEIQGKSEASAKKVLQNCKNLYCQMRESERDNYEFRRRVLAWKRLNHDALADHGRQVSHANCSFSVSCCSSCSPLLLNQILNLAHGLYIGSTNLSESALSKEFISLLFDERVDNIELSRLQRAMIIVLATKSTVGSQMIFDELQMRLKGARSEICASILGELLGEKDVKFQSKFVKLAMETLK